MYELNQIHYDYTVEVTNKFEVIDLVNRTPEELWKEVQHIVQKAVNKTMPKEGAECKRETWSSEEALQIAVERRESKGKKERERYT